MKEIKVEFTGFEKAPSGELEIIYIPNETQTLYAGKAYRMLVNLKQGWFVKTDAPVPVTDVA